MADSNGAAVSLRHRIAALRSVARTKINLIQRQRRPGILHVLHGRRGGTDKYVRELIAATHDVYRHYLLVTAHDRWQLFDMNGDVTATYEFRSQRASDDDWLGALCSWLSVGLVHVHSLVDTGELAAMFERTAVPYCYTVWDMYLPCPTVLLIDSSGVYCNATTDPTTCNRCLAKFDGLKDIEIVAWRRRFGAFLANATRVLAPSQWARDTLAKYFPDIRIEVSPPRPVHVAAEVFHLRPSAAFDLPDDGFRHIGVLGAVGPEKGARQVEALAQRIRERRLPLRIVVVGYMDRMKRDQAPDRVLTVHGHYDESEVASLLDHYRISMLIFPTIWPETFSYTLSEGWSAGRAALVPPVGALPERVVASGAGWVIRGWPDVDAMLDQLLELTAPENAPELERRAGLGKVTAAVESGAQEPMRIRYPEMLARSPGIGGRPLPLSRILRAALQSVATEPAGGANAPQATDAASPGTDAARSVHPVGR